ncbi:MAG TPA: hypothetical protein VIU38_03030 [Anaerolineales bacterium]
MGESISKQRFVSEFFAVFTEAFETHHGIFLDKDTSLFDTLATITAAEASIPIGGKCATLAAQAGHVNFYLEVLEKYIRTGDAGRVDWGEIWRTVNQVTPDEWNIINSRLRETYDRVSELLRSWQDWDDDRSIGGALAMAVHSAYHLGEIRQALCTLR